LNVREVASVIDNVAAEDEKTPRLTADIKCQNGSRLFGFETLLKTRCHVFVALSLRGRSTNVSGSFDLGLIHQQNRNVIADGVNPVALTTFQAFAVSFQGQRLLADWANQNVQQILRNHEQIVLQWLQLRSA
jgi:hypothetical protein